MNNKDGNFISAVIYLPRDGSEVDKFLERVSGVLDDNFKRFELICVDDNANAEAVSQVRSFKERHADILVSLVRMGFRQGIEPSMNAGVDHSIGDFVFEFDSCCIDYNEELIMDVYRKAQEGYDIVSAVPPARYSRLSSRLFYKLFNSASKMPRSLRSERFRLISRRAINRIESYSQIIPYRKAVYASVGLNMAAVEYEPLKKSTGNPLAGSEDRSGTAVDALVVFTDIAYKISLALTVIMAVIMIAAGIYTVCAYVGDRKPVEGWAPIMGLISLGFFSVFAILSVLIKYADVILKLVFVRQKYVVVSVEKL